jgi:hypothetical protein
MKRILLAIFLITGTSTFAWSAATYGGEGTNVPNAVAIAATPGPPPTEEFSFPQGNDEALNSVIFFPNPVKDVLTVRFPRKGNYTVTIFNILGDRVTDKTVLDESDVKLDLSELQNGMFFLSYEFDGKVVSKRFSKTN